MALSIAELIIISLLVDWAFRKLRMPGLIGMLFAGVLLGANRGGDAIGQMLVAVVVRCGAERCGDERAHHAARIFSSHSDVSTAPSIIGRRPITVRSSRAPIRVAT